MSKCLKTRKQLPWVAWGAIYDEVGKHGLEVVGAGFGSIGIGGFITGEVIR